jgi:hypothetical protein
VPPPSHAAVFPVLSPREIRSLNSFLVECSSFARSIATPCMSRPAMEPINKSVTERRTNQTIDHYLRRSLSPLMVPLSSTIARRRLVQFMQLYLLTSAGKIKLHLTNRNQTKVYVDEKVSFNVDNLRPMPVFRL